MSLSKDFIEFIECFNAHRVKYLLVGGHALAFHGLPRFTKDIDFFIYWTSGSMHKQKSHGTRTGCTGRAIIGTDYFKQTQSLIPI
ncbi:MAG: nucleotidyl transferase AbiEii/AbiGii toxin family protein [Myxococcota bacterium]|nr:nucleotidyl transferase AbiEii/AbiGii toxin family protein [Myxococcota bacterium]